MTRLSLLGAGTVGGAFAELVAERPELGIEISSVLVRDLNRSRVRALDPQTFTTDPAKALDADVIVEVMGGTDLAGDLLLKALSQGKKVITANKAVLAERWDEFKDSIAAGQVYFEASVMAGTPSIEPLTGVMRGSQTREIHAILNGTCNYIIGQLEAGKDYATALKEAQDLGYAEADPTLDVGGFDTAHKATLLAKLAVDPNITWQEVKAHTKGIDSLQVSTVQGAKQKGDAVRLVASVFPQAGRWQLKVRPVYLKGSHPLAKAASNRNALYIKGDALEEVLIIGPGAGGKATASGVLADLLKVLEGIRGPQLLKTALKAPEQVMMEGMSEL
ncbi:MAG: homoserine dehydrogenase [Deinococcales bacterium]